MSFLLDTNVVSELRRPSGDASLRQWFASVPSAAMYLSVLSLGEIRQGIDRLRPRDPRQAESLDGWLDSLRNWYADRLLAVTAEIAEEWGRLNVNRTYPVIDGLMAATAMVHHLVVVTRNEKDYDTSRVRVLNPFSSI